LRWYSITFPPPIAGGRSAALIKLALLMVRSCGVALVLGLRVGAGGGVSHEHCAKIKQLPMATAATPNRPSLGNAFLVTRTGPGRDVMGTLCAAIASGTEDFVFVQHMWQT
jgi:hypothetical protein